MGMERRKEKMMNGLKKMLLQEQYRLERILGKTKDRLKDVPEGSLRLSKTKKWVQYYCILPGQKKNGVYIPKAEEKLIYKLAQKGYDEKIVKLAEKRLAQIKRLTKDYEEEELEKIFLNEHKEKQKLIQPVEPTWEQRITEWISEDYKGKEFQEDMPVILTGKGERVRSKSEKILADYFYRNNSRNTTPQDTKTHPITFDNPARFLYNY